MDTGKRKGNGKTESDDGQPLFIGEAVLMGSAMSVFDDLLLSALVGVGGRLGVNDLGVVRCAMLILLVLDVSCDIGRDIDIDIGGRPKPGEAGRAMLDDGRCIPAGEGGRANDDGGPGAGRGLVKADGEGARTWEEAKAPEEGVRPKV